MTNHTLQGLEAKSDSELDEIVALVQGWELAGNSMHSEGNEYHIPNSPIGRKINYHPTQPTESGKAQCFDLMVKYDVYPKPSSSNMSIVYMYNLSEALYLKETSLEKAIVIAAILSAQGEQL